MESLSNTLALWTANLAWSDIPPEIVHRAKLQVLDMIGAMLAGRDDDVCVHLRSAAQSEDYGSGTKMVGFADDVGVRAAALMQGVMSSVLEFDDSHVATGIHIGTPVVSAALSLGQRQGVTGRQLLAAVVVGSELGSRLGLVAPGILHRYGFHPTAIFGVFGATYAIASMRRLPPATIANATGIAGSLAAGIMASWVDGTAAKSLHGGWAATSAISAVQFAEAGLTGPSGVYEGRFGLFPSHVQDGQFPLDYACATDALGERWELANVASRPYPCGHYIQPFLDACAALAGNEGIGLVENIVEIVCLVADYMVPLICEPRLEKLAPKTSWHARYSLQICVAELLVSGRFDKTSLSQRSLNDERIRTLAAKVSCRVDAEARDRNKWSGDVQISWTDGRVAHHRVEHLRGTPGNPMSDDDIYSKFRANAAGVLADSQIDPTIERIRTLEDVDDVRSAFASLSQAEHLIRVSQLQRGN